MLLNVAAHNVSIQNVKLWQRYRHTTRQRDCHLDTVHIFSLLGGLTVGETKRCRYMSPPRMRSNAVGGGGGTILDLGVGRCSYDASTGLPPGLEV
jgi:hypothetical protein